MFLCLLGSPFMWIGMGNFVVSIAECNDPDVHMRVVDVETREIV